MLFKCIYTYKQAPTDAAQKLFQYMVNNDPSDISESIGGVRIFDGASLHWPVAGKEPLFIRKCHDDIFQKMYGRMKDGKAGIIMIGNPGLGKSFSIPYHLWRFVRKDRAVVVYSSKRQTAWVFNKHLSYEKLVKDVQDLISEIPELSDEKTVFLWDPDERSHSEPPTMNVSLTQTFTHSLILFTRHLLMCC